MEDTKVVSIKDCLRYIQAVEEAAEREILDLPLEDRSFMLGLIKVNMLLSAKCIERLQAELEKRGDATPITDEQKHHFELMLRLTLKSKTS